MRLRRRTPTSKQGGIAAVEFAIVALLFFTLVCGIIELCRIIYMYNTLAEVTRRAASAAANTDPAALDAVRQNAVFQQSPGTLPFGDPITDKNIRIEHLSLTKQGNGSYDMTAIPTGSLPACPAQNVQNCLADQYGASCIRLVRVSVCDTGDSTECKRVQYQPLFPFVNLSVSLPTSVTIVKAGSLGYTPGAPLCN